MARAVTLFTGQWADLPLDDLAAKCETWGFDGLELACWGDHFEVDRVLAEDQYAGDLRDLLGSHGLECWALGAHLVGQAVCDRIDARHRAILPPEVWGDGGSDGVRARAAERMKDTARAAARFGVTQVNGFTGSSIWHLLSAFPRTTSPRSTGHTKSSPKHGHRYSTCSTQKACGSDSRCIRPRSRTTSSRRGRLWLRSTAPAFGINLDPSHFAHQHLDAAEFGLEFADRIYTSSQGLTKGLDGRRSILGSHLNFGDEARGWDFVSPGHGDVDFEALFRSLNRIDYRGPLSIEWEDSGMDRDYGAQDALAFVRRTDFPASGVAFDAAMQSDAT